MALFVLLSCKESLGAMDEPPKLVIYWAIIDFNLVQECLNDGMRMHFIPDLNRPFSGHVYVKGFFFSQNCHLDYTKHALTGPFYFHVPYNSTCQVSFSAFVTNP
jgi:hypothetical protein